MSKTVVTPKSYFKTLNILSFALLAGQVMFAGIALFINHTQPIATVFTSNVEQLLLMVVVWVAAINIAVSHILFTAKIKAIRKETHWKQRLEKYQSAIIIRFALMEMPSLLAIVLFMLTGNMLFLIVTVGIVLVFLILKPSLNAMVNHLQLQYDEVVTLQNSDAVLYEKEWALD